MTARTTPRADTLREGQPAASRTRVMRGQLDVPGGHRLQYLGALVRDLRTERELSERALARRSATARSTITRLEHGQLRPRYSLLTAVALGLDVDRQKEVLGQLLAAVGDAMAPETDGTQRWRRKRLERGILRGDVPLPTRVQRALDLHRAADALWIRENAILDDPANLDDARALEECLRIGEQRRRLREEAGPPVSLWIGKVRITAGWGMP